MRDMREAVLSTLEIACRRPSGNQFSHMFKILETRCPLLCSPNASQALSVAAKCGAVMATAMDTEQGGSAGGGCAIAGDEAAAGGGH